MTKKKYTREQLGQIAKDLKSGLDILGQGRRVGTRFMITVSEHSNIEYSILSNKYEKHGSDYMYDRIKDALAQVYIDMLADETLKYIERNPEEMVPIIYIPGNWYLTLAGNWVKVLEQYGPEKRFCMRCSDGKHRYNTADSRGRVTGIEHDFSCEDNFFRLYDEGCLEAAKLEGNIAGAIEARSTSKLFMDGTRNNDDTKHIKELEAQNLALRNKVNVLLSEKSGLETRLQQTEAKLVEEEGFTRTENQKRQEVENALSLRTDQLNGVRDELSTTRHSLAELKRELRDCKSKNGGLAKQLLEERTNRPDRDLDARVEELEGRLVGSRMTVERLKSRVAELEDDLKGAKSANERLVSVNASILKEVELYKSANVMLEGQMNARKADVEAYRRNVGDLHRQKREQYERDKCTYQTLDRNYQNFRVAVAQVGNAYPRGSFLHTVLENLLQQAVY